MQTLVWFDFFLFQDESKCLRKLNRAYSDMPIYDSWLQVKQSVRSSLVPICRDLRDRDEFPKHSMWL